MKRFILILAAALSLVSCSGQFNALRAIQGGVYALQAVTLTDDQVRDYVHQYITQLDAQSTVMPENSAYTRRLRNLTLGLTDVDGVPLNFKVYKENEVNAFACADGSVRVYTGIMDAMTDHELMGVIGHEIGHVALKHTRKQMQQAMLTSAALEGIASTGDTAAALTDSQLGAIGEAIVGAQFSKSQESQADDYGYSFLVNTGRNPWAIVMSFEKLQQLANGSQPGPVENLFSTHPDTATRIQRMTEKCEHDGYERPAK
jgi:putative metalloprotease